MKLIAITDLARNLGISVQAVYDRIAASAIPVEYRQFGPSKKGFVRQKYVKRLQKPANPRGRPRKPIAA